MATLYVASTETFVGKSATCIALLDRARRDGFTVSYMKPVSVSATRTEDAVIDEDAAFIRQHFGLAEPLDFVQSRVVPFLEKSGIPVFATLVQDPQLSGVTVADLLEHLGGQLIGSQDWLDKLVEHLLIGAMGAETALSHFRRRTNKAVFTGGDRSDLQLAALETSTSVLILTGNIRPSPSVIDRA